MLWDLIEEFAKYITLRKNTPCIVQDIMETDLKLNIEEVQNRFHIPVHVVSSHFWREHLKKLSVLLAEFLQTQIEILIIHCYHRKDELSVILTNIYSLS